jgi:hypothetical protein
MSRVRLLLARWTAAKRSLANAGLWADMRRQADVEQAYTNSSLRYDCPLSLMRILDRATA